MQELRFGPSTTPFGGRARPMEGTGLNESDVATVVEAEKSDHLAERVSLGTLFVYCVYRYDIIYIYYQISKLQLHESRPGMSNIVQVFVALDLADLVPQ